MRELLKPVPHAEAMAFIRTKPAVSRQTFDRLLPELRSRAFTVSGIPAFDVLQKIRDRISELPGGAAWDDVKRDIASDLSPYIVDENSEAIEAQRAAADRRAELLMRVHGFQAYQAARYQLMQRNVDALPYWQYLTMEDENVRKEHWDLRRLILPANSPFWIDHYPPWDWGCRCQVVPVSADVYAQARDGDRETGFVLSERLERELVESGRLALPDGRVTNVMSPVRRGKENAFAWDPGSLSMSESALRAKYDQTVFDRMVTWMKSIRVDDNGVESRNGSKTLYDAMLRDRSAA
jgi:hypothetical protein